MDKYEYRVSLNEINSLVQERRFNEAAEIADTIDWRKVKSADTLCRISDIYKICKDYERARDILDIANARNPHVPNIIYSLCDLTIYLYGQTGSQADLAKALGLKQEFESECPDDPKRLILEYKFYKVSPVTLEEKIATLEQLRDEDPTARWEYELATLYHQNGQDDLALNECRDIRRAYSGKFADKAAALAEEISPSTPAAPAEEPATTSEAPAEPVEAAPAEEAVTAQAPAEPAESAPTEETAPAEESVRTYTPVHITDEEPAQESAPVQESAEEDLPAEQPAAASDDPESAPQAQDAAESLSVGQVYDEWERIRRDIRKRNDEQRAQRIMQDTGPLLQDFDETARHGLIETIEKEAARQRRQARSGASRILGDDGYAAGDRYDNRRYEPLPSQDDNYPEEEEAYPEDRYSDDNYQDEQYSDDRYAEDDYRDDVPAEEAPVEREAITAETVHEEERPAINDQRSYDAPRGSAFNAAVAAAAGAAAGAGVGVAAAEAEDIATRRWNSDEIRAAMEQQKAAAEEAARKEAEEKARQEAEAAARAEAERKAAERAQIEAEVRAQIAAEQKAAQEKAAAEEAARKEAEAKAAAEEQARKEAEAKAAAEKQQMYDEIEAKIRAEYEARLAAAAPVAAAVEEPDEVVEEDVEQLADDTDDGINQISPEEEPDVPAEEDSCHHGARGERSDNIDDMPHASHADDLAEAIEQQTADTSAYDHIEPLDTDAHEGENADEAAEQYEPATSGNPVAPAISTETDTLPASAASNIASANEKAPSPEELRLFGPFYRMKENRDQVTTALDSISLASYTGNIIITGNAVTARRVAQGLLELTREADSNFTGKIAKATGTALNNLTDDKFHAILTKIENGALIIEHASAMEEAAVQRLYNELEGREHGIIVVLMDARKPLDAFLADYQSKVGSFTARVDIRPLNDKALVDYGKDYANSKDYALDEMAELALASRISGMQSPSHRVTLKEVREIVDEAISYASRKTPATLMGMLSRKRYDEDDRIILHEKDFQHY